MRWNATRGRWILIVGALIIVGCESATESAREWPPDIPGVWTWVRSVHASGTLLTPASEGYTSTLAIAPVSPGSNAGTYTYSIDGVVVAEGSYVIGAEDAPGNDFVIWEPAFGPYHDMTWITIAVGDTLLLNDATVNGYDSRWSRS